VQELFAFVSIRFAAAAAGFDAKKMRLHCGVAPSQQLHTDRGAGLKDFTLRRTNKGLGVPVRFEHGKDIRFVEARDAAEGGDRGAHLAALERAEKTDRDTRGSGDLSQRESAPSAQTPEPLAGRRERVSRSGNDALLVQDMYNRNGIQAAGAAQKNGALKQANVGFGVHAVAALGALRRDQAERFPGPQRGGRDGEAAGDLRDAQELTSRRRIRFARKILST